MTITTPEGISGPALFVAANGCRAVVRDGEIDGYAVVVRESDASEWRWLKTFATLELASRPEGECDGW